MRSLRNEKKRREKKRDEERKIDIKVSSRRETEEKKQNAAESGIQMMDRDVIYIIK